jgi:predicted phage gp36 major capsid-like protein
MNDNFKKLAGILSSVAPTLATMLGGPLAGAAVTAITSAFGLGANAGPEDVTKVIQAGGMTPEIIAQVRARDQEHAEKLRQMDIDVLKLNADHESSMATVDAGDRDSARKREIAVRGATTPALAWLVVAASVSLGAAVVAGLVTKDPAQATLVGTVIGYVFSEAKQVLAYYFGSSAGSERKTELMAASGAKE